MNFVNFKIGWKVWWSVFFSIMLIVGWAITPVLAHCDGKHTGNHPHCGNDDPPPPLPPGDADPAIVYEARSKVRSALTHSIFVVNSDGTNRLPVIEGTNELSYSDASWSPDGKGLVFSVHPLNGTENPSREPGLYTIWMIEENGEWTGQWTVPLFVGPVGGDPAWHPGGSLIAYSQQRPGTTPDGSENSDIVLVNADGSNSEDPVVLTNTPTLIEWGPTWSPDGSQFAVEKWQLWDSDLVIYDFDIDYHSASLYLDLDLSDGDVASPNWSKTPNSNLIAISGGSGIYCIDLEDPDNPVFVTNTNIAWQFVWSSDDKRAVVSLGGIGGGVSVLELDYANETIKCPTGILSQTVIEEATHQVRVWNPDWRRGTLCGNGILNVSEGEQCDDGNRVDGDSCSAMCMEEI